MKKKHSIFQKKDKEKNNKKYPKVTSDNKQLENLGWFTINKNKNGNLD